MSYQTAITIIDVLNLIDRKKYVLPSIQREFVWNTHQIEQLFDSLMKDYPISSFLFWKVNKEHTKNYSFYEFVKDYHERDNFHNAKADYILDEDTLAVLDGQQRLTSLYIGIMGSYAEKIQKKNWDDENAYPVKRLYLNLLGYSEDSTDYNFAFLTSEEVANSNEKCFWFLVNDILNFKSLSDVLQYLMENNLTNTSIYDSQICLFSNRTLSKLYEVVHISKTISYYLEQSDDLNKVLNIFLRINSGGTVLNYSDLLLSIAIAQWEDIDARKEFHDFVDELNSIGDKFNFNKDIILKSALYLSDFEDIAFKVNNFNKENMKIIENNWSDITKYLRMATNLVHQFSYNRDNFTSNYALIPIAYYLKKINAKDDFIFTENEEKTKLKKWLVISLVKQVFNRNPDSILKNIRKALQIENTDLFPINKIMNINVYVKT